MENKCIIRSFFKPTIELEELSQIDIIHGTNADGEKSDIQQDANEGKMFPLVVINGVEIAGTVIEKFELSLEDFVPEMSIRFTPSSQEFTSEKMPVDGNIMKLFIRSNSTAIKPIRIDFLITEVSVPRTGPTPELAGATITVRGRMNIPHLYDEVNFSEEGTSIEVLQKVAEELGLGFSSNVTETDDKMHWVCSYKTREQFMKDVVDAAWLNEKTFFTAFIDPYYYLNLVEVNAQMTECDEPLKGDIMSMFSEFDADLDNDNGLQMKMLSNIPPMIESNYGIKEYKPMNEAAEIAKTFGYKYKLKFFDYATMAPVEFEIEPIMSENAAASKQVMRGKPHDDSYKDQVKTNFLGIQYPDNVHEMYYYAKAHNMMNLLETRKMGIKVKLNKYNLNFIKYDVVPVLITLGATDPNAAERVTKYDEDKPEDYHDGADDPVKHTPAMDKFYSGTYLVRSFKITYSDKKGDMEEEMVLNKREWAAPY